VLAFQFILAHILGKLAPRVVLRRTPKWNVTLKHLVALSFLVHVTASLYVSLEDRRASSRSWRSPTKCVWKCQMSSQSKEQGAALCESHSLGILFLSVRMNVEHRWMLMLCQDSSTSGKIHLTQCLTAAPCPEGTSCPRLAVSSMPWPRLSAGTLLIAEQGEGSISRECPMLAHAGCPGAILSSCWEWFPALHHFYSTGAGLHCPGEAKMPISHRVCDDCSGLVSQWALSPAWSLVLIYLLNK